MRCDVFHNEVGYFFNMHQTSANMSWYKTWEKLLLAANAISAKAIAVIENPADFYVLSSHQYGHRDVLKTAGSLLRPTAVANPVFFNPAAAAAAFVPISGWHSDNTLNVGGPAPSASLNPLVNLFAPRFFSDETVNPLHAALRATMARAEQWVPSTLLM